MQLLQFLWLSVLTLACLLRTTTQSAENPAAITAKGLGLGGTSDQFDAQLSNVTGNFDVRIRVLSLTRVDAWSEAGLVARQSINPSAPFAAALCTPSISGCFFKSRKVSGQSGTASGSFPPNFPQTWLRLRRSGNEFTGYAGFDGTNWAQLGTVNITMPATVLVGYGVASHNLTNGATAEFSEYGATPADAQEDASGSVEPLGPSSRFTSVVFSEIMYHPVARTDGRKLEFIELFNTAELAQDLSGYRISGDVDFTFPAGTKLPGGAFLVVARVPADIAAVYGLSGVMGPFEKDKNLPNNSGTIRLRNRQGAVLLEVPYRSSTPWPVAAAGSGKSLVLARPSWGEAAPNAWDASAVDGGTPGAINFRTPKIRAAASHSPATQSLVFNEIYYHPISGNDDEQFVELYNVSSQTVDLTGWQIEGGISYTFPDSAVVAAGGYLVIAKNATRLQTNYAGLNSTNTLGNFSGKLSHRGERLSLTRPGANATERVVVDALSYRGGGRWGKWSDGGGSSLEKIDPRADGQFAANWADSDESNKAPWTAVAATGRLDNGNVAADQLQILMQGAGECLVDDVQVLNASGANLIANSDFTTGSTGWIAEGTEQTSGWQSSGGETVYRIRAVERGDNQVNRVRTALTSSLAGNTTATIQARVRWLKGSPYVLFRLRGNWLEAATRLTVPANPGTPGAPNSRLVLNAGPAISDVQHWPTLPAAGESVRVTAHVSDPDGAARVILRYRLDPATASTAIPMVDDGSEGDELAGDGIYTALLPGQGTGTLAAFWIQASDTLNASASFPEEPAGHECLVRFGEAMPSGNLPVYRLWMTQATYNEWTGRHKLNNTPLDVTFVLGNSRAIYNAQALYAGSPYIAPGYSSPTSGRCGYTLSFPSDDAFLGTTALVLDWPGGHGGERTGQQEQMAYWLAERMEIPYSHRYTIRLFVNGVRDMDRAAVFEAVNQPDGDFLNAWLPDNPDGDFYKIDRAFEFSDAGGLAADPQPRLQVYTTTGGAKKTARYRWNWMKRSSDDPNDYANIFSLVDAVNTAPADLYTANTEALVDIDEWMGIFAFEHIIVNFDAYGHEIGKNMYAYKPQSGNWQLYAFDLDWLMLAAAGRGSSYAAGNAALFNSEDPTISRMYNHPPFRRAYFQAVQRAVDGPMQAAICDPVLDAKYQSLVANGITYCDGQPLTDPSVVKTWFAQRRTYLQNQLAKVDGVFSITTNNGNDFTSDTNRITIAGAAPLAMKTLQVNGVDQHLDWTAVNAWQLATDLLPGGNALEFAAYDSAGALLAEAHLMVTTPFSRPNLSIQLFDGGWKLAWNTDPGISYTLESTSSLNAGPWAQLQSLVATERSVSIAIPEGETRQRFYRVRSSVSMPIDP